MFIEETRWYKCKKCGEVMMGEDITIVTENLGINKYGEHGEETYPVCPHCRSDRLIKLGECVICGEHTENEHDGLCDRCIEQYENNIDECFEIGENSTESLDLNCFLASMFSRGEIEEILLEVLKRDGVDCRRFIEEDPVWFGDRAAERLKERVENVNK